MAFLALTCPDLKMNSRNLSSEIKFNKTSFKTHGLNLISSALNKTRMTPSHQLFGGFKFHIICLFQT